MSLKRQLKLVLIVAGCGWLAAQLAAENVLTAHNDIARTGRNLHETILTPTNVASADFGKLFSQSVDGFVYAQPLVVTNLNIAGGVHDVVFVATEHDSVYAFDAHSNVPALWQTSFINPAAGVTTASSDDVGCDDLVPEVGITSTPVIDLNRGTIYVSAKTKEVTTNGTSYYCRLHALDLATGAEKFGGPATIQPVASGKGDGSDSKHNIAFDALTQFNRAALLLDNGIVYLGFAAHCDNFPYHGWLIGFNATNLQMKFAFNTTPNGGDGGIWHAGGGPACDTNHNIFVITGNGTFKPLNKNYGDSFLRLSASSGQLKLADFFTPYNQARLSAFDLDLGSGGPLVLPDEAGSRANRHLLVGAGKEGTVYLINRSNMRHYNSVKNLDVQTLPNLIAPCFSTPAYFNNKLYFAGAGDVLKSFSITNAHISTVPIAQAADTLGFPGATPSISASGATNGIVWLLQTDAYAASGPAILRAYNADDLTQELFDSSAAGETNQAGAAVKFSVPTVANGNVYVGGQYSLTVYGLLDSAPVPNVVARGEVKLQAQGRGHIRVNGAVKAGEKAVYVLQASTNLTTWVSIQTNAVPAGAEPRFDDAEAAKYPNRFYRVIRLK
jgi:hypothetical protein